MTEKGLFLKKYGFQNRKNITVKDYSKETAIHDPFRMSLKRILTISVDRRNPKQPPGMVLNPCK